MQGVCHMFRFFSILISALVALVSAESHQKPKSPLATEKAICRKVTKPPVLDGILNDHAWKNAEPIDKFPAFWDGTASNFGTIAYLTWDDQALYFAGSMTDTELRSFGIKQNDKLWFGDVFELFLKPNSTKPQYFEFQVNPQGTRLEIPFPTRGYSFDVLAKEPSLGMTVSVKTEGTVNKQGDTDKHWTVEGSIPWSAFSSVAKRPEVGDAWKFAICRYDYGPDGTQPSLVSSAPLTKSSFHRYEDYGLLLFTGPGEVSQTP
jgi:hypothetical protein